MPRLTRAGHHRQDHKPQHVIQDCRTQDHLRFPHVQPLQVLQDPGGNADTGGSEGRRQEYRNKGVLCPRRKNILRTA